MINANDEYGSICIVTLSPVVGAFGIPGCILAKIGLPFILAIYKRPAFSSAIVPSTVSTSIGTTPFENIRLLFILVTKWSYNCTSNLACKIISTKFFVWHTEISICRIR